VIGARGTRVAQYFSVHPDNPQGRLISRVADIIQSGGVIAYPTDSCYALGCGIGTKEAGERIRAVRGLPEGHHLTLVCSGLAQVAQYARVDDARFRIIKRVTPGSYVFILPATKEVPRRLRHPRRKTIGVRIPDHAVVRALLEALHEPLLSSTLLLAGDEYPLNDGAEIRARLDRSLDAVLDAGSCGLEPSTVVDLTADLPVVVRQGKGPSAGLGWVGGG
jgi:tRNA threonylcarbamoyl adenosine modification protein (Sua5/YciO/YrdC/YwlC family)